MNTRPAPVPGVPVFAWLAFVVPLVCIAIVWALGMMPIVRLAALGGVAAVAGAAVFTRPVWGVYFLAFYTWAGLGTVLPGAVASAITLVTFASVLVAFARGQSCRLRDSVFWWSLGFFLLFSVQAMLFAWRVDRCLMLLAAYLKAFLVVFLIVQLVDTHAKLWRLAGWIFAGAVATVVLGVVGLRLGFVGVANDAAGMVQTLRFSGLHGDPNTGPAYMCAAIPLGVFFVRTERSRWLRALYTIGIVVVAAGTFASFSRAAFFSFAVVLVMIAMRETRSPRSLTLVVVLTTILLVLAPSSYWERVSNLSKIADQVSRDWSVLMRYRALTAAWHLFTTHPLTGIGLGNFMFRGAYAVWIRIVVHDSFMEVLVSVGVFGFSAFAGLLASGFRPLAAAARRPWVGAPVWMRHFGFYAAVAQASTLVSAIFMSTSYRYLLWLPVALGLVVGSLPGGRPQMVEPPERSPRTTLRTDPESA